MVGVSLRSGRVGEDCFVWALYIPSQGTKWSQVYPLIAFQCVGSKLLKIWIDTKQTATLISGWRPASISFPATGDMAYGWRCIWVGSALLFLRNLTGNCFQSGTVGKNANSLPSSKGRPMPGPALIFFWYNRLASWLIVFACHQTEIGLTLPLPLDAV